MQRQQHSAHPGLLRIDRPRSSASLSRPLRLPAGSLSIGPAAPSLATPPAKGDGVQDDTAAFSRAIAAASRLAEQISHVSGGAAAGRGRCAGLAAARSRADARAAGTTGAQRHRQPRRASSPHRCHVQAPDRGWQNEGRAGVALAVPRGTYKLTQALEITQSNVVLRGAGVSWPFRVDVVAQACQQAASWKPAQPWPSSGLRAELSSTVGLLHPPFCLWCAARPDHAVLPQAPVRHLRQQREVGHRRRFPQVRALSLARAAPALQCMGRLQQGSGCCGSPCLVKEE